MAQIKNKNAASGGDKRAAPIKFPPSNVVQLLLPFWLDNCERDFKQASRRNKKLRFRKSDNRRRAEKIAPSCPL
jgi:hypothetical protein